MKEEQSASLSDYYIPQKVGAFMRSYAPCQHEREASDVFTCQKLRQYFQAYPVPMLGDLLSLYIDELESNGYLLTTSITGEPAIFVTAKSEGTPLLPGLLEEDKKEEEGDLQLGVSP